MSRDEIPEELSDEQLDELRDRLETLRGELEVTLSDSTEGSRPVDLDQPIGRVSRIDAIQQQKMVAAGRRNHEQRLRLVKAALARIAAGDYGLCASCEEPIAHRRLRARPESPMCLRCQSARER